MSIVAWASLESKNKGLLNWFLLQCIKKSSTLRVSPKGGKPSPRVVVRYGNQNIEIRNFLRHRRGIKNIMREINRGLVKKQKNPGFSGFKNDGSCWQKAENDLSYANLGGR